MDPSKKAAADELHRQFPHLSLAEAFAVLERHRFSVDAAAREVRSTFAASAGDHGVMYEMPPATGSAGPDGLRGTMDDIFRQGNPQGGSTGGRTGDEGQAFFGTGRRLGHTEAASPVIAASVRQQRTITVSVYANEIHVGGAGDVAVKPIPLNTPEAKAFMDDLKAGVIPRSLEALYPNCDLDVELQDRMNREYQAPVAQFTAFQNDGHRLGASAGAAAPASAGGSTSYEPGRTFRFDESLDATVVRLVNTKGAQTELRVNPTVHTVEDLYLLAHQVEPDRARFMLEVRDMPPRKLGPDTRAQTIEVAKLKRAVVVMRPA